MPESIKKEQTKKVFALKVNQFGFKNIRKSASSLKLTISS